MATDRSPARYDHYHHHYHFHFFLEYNSPTMKIEPYHCTFTLPQGDGDPPPALLLRLLEELLEAAGRHAGLLGVGVRDLHAQGLTWVLARLHVLALAPLPAGAEVRIATWPAGRHRLLALREFQVRDARGAETLRASSAWALMNLETRRPARLDPHLPVFASHPGRMLEDDFPPLPPPSPRAPTRLHRAEAEDIDLNDHVNTMVYIGWALASAPDAVRSRPLQELEAAFLGEARLGDRIGCLTEIGHGAAPGAGPGSGTVLLQSLRDESSGKELTRLRSRWQGFGGLKHSL